MIAHVLEVGERYAFAAHSAGIFLAVFRGRCRTADVTALRKQLASRIQASPSTAELRVLVVMEDRATLGARGRSEVGALLREHTRIAAWANVVESDGFWASAVRGITTAILLLARPQFALKTFGSVGDAAAWLLGDAAPTAASLPGVIEELRARIGTSNAAPLFAPAEPDV
jgi:hypothetical protein